MLTPTRSYISVGMGVFEQVVGLGRTGLAWVCPMLNFSRSRPRALHRRDGHVYDEEVEDNQEGPRH